MAAARRAGRDKVGCIILGRHEDDNKVRQWLTTAAAVPGFIGFAVGRTTFWDPLVDYRAQKITRDTAVARIAASYRSGWTCSRTPIGGRGQQRLVFWRTDNDSRTRIYGPSDTTTWGGPTRSAMRSPGFGWATGKAGKYLFLLDIAVVVRHPDGSFTFDRKPFPSVRNILGCTAVGFLAGLVLAAPLTGATLGALVGGAGTAASAAAAGIGDDFIQEVELLMKPGTSALFVLDQEGDIRR